jgi:hypothetical protein
VKVTLTYEEHVIAGHIGVMRNAYNRRADAYGAERGNPWGPHVLGALGECAVAKALNLYWHPHVGRYDGDDVGPYQVRTTRFNNDRQLILHPRDADDKKFVCVYGVIANFELKGWCFARDGKKQEHWCDYFKNGRPAFFVPNHLLHPMTELNVERVARAVSSLPHSSQSQLFADDFAGVTRDGTAPEY